MKGSMLLLVLFSLLAISNAGTPLYPYTYCGAPNKMDVPQTNYTLEFVQAFTRHGDRTTLTMLPGYNNEFLCNLTTYMFPSMNTASTASIPRLYRKNYLQGRETLNGNCNFGQLTGRGYDQHIALGEQLRSLYVDTLKFLSPNLSTSEIWIRSTDIYRTVQSAQANMYGFFPGTPGQSNIPVVDMYTMDLANENMFSNDDMCPRGVEVLQELLNNSDYVAYDNSWASFKKQLAGQFGVSVADLPVWGALFDAFNVLDCYDLPYPAGVTQAQVNNIYTIANWEYDYQLNNSTLTQLWIGDFVAEIVANIQNKIKGQNSYKYMYYSGHDTTIAPLMTAFGAYDGNWPPYASHAQLELWSDNGAYYILLRYQGVIQNLSGCGGAMCPLDVFLQNVKPYVITDYAQQCAATSVGGKKKVNIH